MDRVSLGAPAQEDLTRDPAPASRSSAGSCTPAMGPEPSLQRQALSLYCPAKMQPQPHGGSSSVPG